MEIAAQPSPPAEPGKGFFKSLMDTRFDHLITPKMVRFLYIVAMIVLTAGVIVAIIVAFTNDAGTGLLTLFLAPIGGLIYLIIARLYLELIVVAFKIREAAEEVASNTRG
jgi:hypothetical protein